MVFIINFATKCHRISESRYACFLQLLQLQTDSKDIVVLYMDQKRTKCAKICKSQFGRHFVFTSWKMTANIGDASKHCSILLVYRISKYLYVTHSDN